MGNNPIMMVDPDGGKAKNAQEEENVDGNIPEEYDADLKAAKRLMLESFKFDYVYGDASNGQWAAQGKGEELALDYIRDLGTEMRYDLNVNKGLDATSFGMGLDAVDGQLVIKTWITMTLKDVNADPLPNQIDGVVASGSTISPPLMSLSSSFRVGEASANTRYQNNVTGYSLVRSMNALGGALTNVEVTGFLFSSDETFQLSTGDGSLTLALLSNSQNGDIIQDNGLAITLNGVNFLPNLGFSGFTNIGANPLLGNIIPTTSTSPPGRNQIDFDARVNQGISIGTNLESRFNYRISQSFRSHLINMPGGNPINRNMYYIQLNHTLVINLTYNFNTLITF